MVGLLLSPINQEAKIKTDWKEARLIGFFPAHVKDRRSKPKAKDTRLPARLVKACFWQQKE